MGRFTTWDKGYTDWWEIRRLKKHQKIDLAISILKHDGVKVTAKEVNRLMKFHKTGLVTIFHDDHHGKRITKSGLHGGRYVSNYALTQQRRMDFFTHLRKTLQLGIAGFVLLALFVKLAD